MGLLSPFRSARTGPAPSGGPAPRPAAPEPDPERFTLLSTRQLNGWTIVEAHYPGCTTYEGRKLLVYACREADVIAAKLLDPHFGDRAGQIFPVARLEPTERGLAMAELLCRNAPRK